MDIVNTPIPHINDDKVILFDGECKLCNACLFGLNRFFWIWIMAYPSMFWFQQRIFS